MIQLNKIAIGSILSARTPSHEYLVVKVSPIVCKFYDMKGTHSAPLDIIELMSNEDISVRPFFTDKLKKEAIAKIQNYFSDCAIQKPAPKVRVVRTPAIKISNNFGVGKWIVDSRKYSFERHLQ